MQDEETKTWIETSLDFIPELIGAIGVLVVAFMIAGLVRERVKKASARVTESRSLQGLFAALARVVVIILGAVIALRILDLDGAVASLLAGAGIIGLALGFAFQDSASNFIAGVILSIQKQFQIGDYVEINDTFGNVNRIDLRLTEIKTVQGQIVYVPNKEVLSTAVKDYSKLGERRVDLELGVSYADDLDKVEKVTIETLKSVPGAMDDRPVDMYFTEFGDSSIKLTARFWVRFGKQGDFLGSRSEAIKRLKAAYDQAGISIPFPIRTLDFDAKGGENLATQLKHK